MAGSAMAKSIRWPFITVQAQIDADGTLHAVEKQTIVFDGNWSGGRRQFTVAPNQRFSVDGVTKYDDGALTQLTRGNLNVIDHYDLLPGNELRWRIRADGASPLRHRELEYRISYTLSNVLEQDPDGTWALTHDFSFANRPVSIDFFEVKVVFDPIWRATKPFLIEQRRNLRPGQTVIVEETLRRAKPVAAVATATAASPAAGATTPSIPIEPHITTAAAWTIFRLFAVAVVFLTTVFFYRERRDGRFVRFAPETIDREWLKANLLALRPELAGAIWDRSIGASEVAATLARLTAEKKISTTIETSAAWGNPRVMHMKLENPYEELRPWEQELVKGLFLGKTETDTAAIREYYRKSGFNPRPIVERALRPELEALPGWSERRLRSRWWWSWTLLIGGVLLMTTGDSKMPGDLAGSCGTVLISVVSCLLAGLLARTTVHRTEGLGWRFALMITFLLPAGATVLFLSGTALQSGIHPLVLLGAATFETGIWKIVLDIATSSETSDMLRLRGNLRAARNYFAAQLSSRQPDLNDEWYPYVVAFGLDQQADAWFRAFGPAATVVPVMVVPGSTVVVNNRSNGWGSGSFSSGWGSSARHISSTSGSDSPAPPSSDSSSSSSSSSSDSSGSGNDSSSGNTGGGSGGGW
jgi:hypothetical protein